MSWSFEKSFAVHVGGPRAGEPPQVPPGADPQRKFGERKRAKKRSRK